MTRKSPRRRSLRLKTRTPQSGVRTLRLTMNEEKPKEEEGFVSRQELLQSGVRTLMPTMTRKSPRRRRLRLKTRTP
jgi:hypothetical protein